MKPLRSTRRGSILDPAYPYVRAADTDLRKTFERVRAEMAAGRRPPFPHQPQPRRNPK